MLDEELKKIWKGTPHQELVKCNKAMLLTDLNTQLKYFNKSITNRNLREMVVAGLLMPIFAFIALVIPITLSKIGAIILALHGGLIIYLLRNVRKHQVQDLSLSLHDYLVQYKRYLLKEMLLLNNIVYWYLLPAAVGLLLFFYGIRPDIIKTLQLFIGVLVVFFIIYYLNKKAVKEDIKPLLQKLEESIQKFEKK